VNSGTIVVILVLVFIFSSLGPKVPPSPKAPGKYPTQQKQIVIPSGTVDGIAAFAQNYGDWVTDEDSAQIGNSIVKYSQTYQIDPRLVAAVIARESKFNKNAVSSSGAQGLGQMLPSTAAGMGVTDSFDIDQNVMGTVKYIRLMLDRWDGHDNQVALALASYKEGYGSIKSNGGNYSEGTARYLKDIMALYGKM